MQTPFVHLEQIHWRSIAQVVHYGQLSGENGHSLVSFEHTLCYVMNMMVPEWNHDEDVQLMVEAIDRKYPLAVEANPPQLLASQKVHMLHPFETSMMTLRA